MPAGEAADQMYFARPVGAIAGHVLSAIPTWQPSHRATAAVEIRGEWSWTENSA
jgi:hypothetical protein